MAEAVEQDAEVCPERCPFTDAHLRGDHLCSRRSLRQKVNNALPRRLQELGSPRPASFEDSLAVGRRHLQQPVIRGVDKDRHVARLESW